MRNKSASLAKPMLAPGPALARCIAEGLGRSPELKLLGDPIGLPRTKSGGAMSGRGSSPPRRAGAYPLTLSRGPARQPGGQAVHLGAG